MIAILVMATLRTVALTASS